MTVWPSDNLPRPTLFEMSPGRINAYFLSPSDPEFELIETQLRSALETACRVASAQGHLERAITSTRPSIIHDEIWNALYHAELLIFDVTRENPSVMMELGVAAAWRLRPQVLVLQNACSAKPIPFNLLPARVLRYTLSPSGLANLRNQAAQVFIWSLSTLPLAEVTRYPRPSVFPFQYPKHAELLITPPLCHRYQRPDGGLEFGAPYIFRHSFALAHTGQRSNVRLEAEMRFSEPQPENPDPPWIGFKLLGSGVLMNHGVGTVVRVSGKVQITYTENESGDPRYYHDDTVGHLNSFNPEKDVVHISASVSKQIFSVRIRCGRSQVTHRLNLVRTAHYRPTSGYCLIQAFRCRAILHQLELS